MIYNFIITFVLCFTRSSFNFKNPAVADVYTEHSCTVNVAKYSPSGFYIASGDSSGKIRIWDTVNKEHLLKNEFQPIGGPIKDIAWSADSQRIVVVGEGRERFGHVFMTETGTSVGEISGQSKPINSVDFRPSRPFRIICGSEDNTIAIFEGPPFKFKKTKQEHSRFVQAVRYSPDGKFFASAGFDGRVFLYDGVSSDLVSEIGAPAHKGGVYAVSWKPDGTHIITASGDKTCKLWNIENRELVSEFQLGLIPYLHRTLSYSSHINGFIFHKFIGNSVEDQQVSCMWQDEYILSVSLSGFINYLDVNNPAKPLRIIKGHNKPITAVSLSEDRSIIYTASYCGAITNWNSGNGVNNRVDGNGHGNQVNGIRFHGDFAYTCGIDDTLKQINVEDNTYTGVEIKLKSQPRGMDVSKEQNIIVVGCVKELVVVKENRIIFSLPINYEAACVSINSETSEVAIGGDDNKIHIYSLSGSQLELKLELIHLGVVTDCVYSPNNKYLVACDSNRKVILYEVPEYKVSMLTDHLKFYSLTLFEIEETLKFYCSLISKVTFNYLTSFLACND